ncbi:uncharacterized protein LOC110991059 isoform X2 [Acanthaster planci]|nr:uncharacterized protein LOC110991059 isoform X2 [Acanthaster planci]
MDEQDDNAFKDEDDPESDGVDGSPSPHSDGETSPHSDDEASPRSDSETDPEGNPTGELETDTAAVSSGNVEDKQAGGGCKEDEGMASRPPGYQDPPSYEETIRMSAIKVEGETPKRDRDEDLEWDQDESVEPNVIVNPFSDLRDGSPQEDIELGEMPGRSPRLTGATAEVTPSGDSIKRFVQPMEIESQTTQKPFHICFSEMNSRSLLIIIFSILIAIVAVLIVVLLPLAFSYVEYYELGLKQQRSTGQVFFNDGAFESGRHAVGPDYIFKKYPSWATSVHLDDIAVITTAGLSLSFSCSFQYFIREEELGLLEQRFDQGYPEVIKFVAEAALKNVAASINLSLYLEQRRQVEILFHDALRAKLGGNCCPDLEECLRYDTCHLCSNSDVCSRGYHINVPFFQLLEINLPDVILDRNLQVQLMHEEAEKETFLQQERLTRKRTEELVQGILNSASEVTNNSTSQASLIQSLGEAEARAIVEGSVSGGLTLMYNSMNVTVDQHKASLHWLRTLEKQDRLVMGVSFQEYMKLIKNWTVT